jgi:hypothetical protein
MATPAGALGCTITIDVFDGSRRPIPSGVEVLYTVRDGNQKEAFRNFERTPSLTVNGLPFFNNFGDRYTVIASAAGYKQAGFTPVPVSPHVPQVVDLMLMAEDASFNFGGAWDAIQARRPVLAGLLAAGSASAQAARDRYNNLLENRSEVLACLLNITTAMEQIHLPVGTPLDYFQEFNWDATMARDRFFGYADAKLIAQVRIAEQQGLFAPEVGTAAFHAGATSSWKQIQFGEANVQLTFHENDRRTINGRDCVLTEPDIDYFKDLLAHAILEVAANGIGGSLTDPRQVYVLRWMAGRRAGIPEFDPLYTIS